MAPPLAALDPATLAAFCREHGVARLWAFGSVLRDDFDPARSDVDLLVEFQAGVRCGYFKLLGMQHEMEDLLGREVDLLTPGELRSGVLDSVTRSARLLYG